MMAGKDQQRGARAARGERAERSERVERREATGVRARRAQDAAATSHPERRNGRGREPAAVVGGAGETAAVGGHAMMDLEFLRGLIGAVDASGIDSIEITRAGTRIRISKTPPALTMPVPTMVQAPAPASPPLPASPSPAPGVAAAPAVVAAPAAAAQAAPAAEPAARTDLLEVKSPMVGTFYRAPAPEAPPYVEVGSYVTKGQTLCILEAMKLMNELESEVEGTVKEVLVDNTEPVEFGQVLFRIEPARR